MYAEKQDSPIGAAPGQSPGAGRRRSRGLGVLRLALIAVVPLALLLTGLGLWWSVQPAKFDVAANAGEVFGELGVGGADDAHPPGTATVAAAVRVAETLLGKPGGYLRNDMTPPGLLIDNMANWEYGVLTELRDSVRALRNDFSRSQTQSVENEALKQADSEFNFDPNAWFLPSAENEYRQGIEELKQYLADLRAAPGSGARFFTRADNLGAYLAVVEKRLGSYGQRLAASVGDPELTAALGGVGGPSAQVLERTARSEIDDIFYEARGYSWALLHMMKALALDFRGVLEDKNAEVSMQQVIRDLEHATVRKWSPVVLNGHGFGALANHSLVLASYMARANAAVLDLRALLQRG